MDESIFQIWDANNFTLLTTFTDERHDMPIIGWSPDGTRIVTSTTFGIRIRDAADGQILRSLEGHTRPIFAFSWNPNNSRLASISADSSVRIWDTGSGATIATFSLNEPGTTIAWDPSGGLLAGGTGQNIQVWDAISLTPVTLLQAHTNVVFDLDWSSYGLASTGVDDSVKVWNTNTWQIASELQVAPNSAAYINWNRTNGYLAILGFDSLVRIWDPATNSVISRAC
jgi:WD40 repeat protein